MPRRATPLIQLVGYQRASTCKTTAAVFDFGVHVIGLVGLMWSVYLLIEWALR